MSDLIVQLTEHVLGRVPPKSAEKFQGRVQSQFLGLCYKSSRSKSTLYASSWIDAS